MSTNSNRVLHGPYVDWTKAQVIAALREAQAELADGGGTITGGSVNGQSFQKTSGPSVLTRIRQLKEARAQVDPDFIAPSGAIRVRFGSGC